MNIVVRNVALHLLNTRTRIPFRYGIATMSAVPHLFVRAEVGVDGHTTFGLAADLLPPKWFTKDPKSAFRDDVADMLRVIQSACALAREIRFAPTAFDFWRQLYAQQKSWGMQQGYPPLLWGFGVSLVERAVLAAFCRATGTNFAHAVRVNSLGVRLGEIHADLANATPADLLPLQPLPSIIVRHTIGLSDPLTASDIAPAERADDGLPQSLEDCIRAYGLTHFKIKLAGEVGKDLARLRRCAAVIQANAGPDFAFTLDGNENYKDAVPFQELWKALAADAALASFLGRLLFVEQPLHRDFALSAETRQRFNEWQNRPPMIIDESDAELGSLPAALQCGYVGTSHKNCKGIFKGIANACLIAHLRKTAPARGSLLSCEDLCNVGPVALLQDLAVISTLGIAHAERNGHHYFRGLSMMPSPVQEQVLAHHGDLYRRHEQGFPTLRIQEGRLDARSVVEAPLGIGFDLDSTRFTPVEEWSFDSLDQ